MKLFSEYKTEEIKLMSEQKINEKIEIEEELAHFASLPQKKYYLATEGVVTKQGGVIHVEQRAEYFVIGTKRVAVVGDYALYPDGSKAMIISGAGEGLVFGNRDVAINQSVLENGDEILELGLSKDLEMIIYDHQIPEGFLVKNWCFYHQNKSNFVV